MRGTNCRWLPKLILRKPSEKEEDYLNRLYIIFCNDLKAHQPLFKGLRVGCRHYPEINGREEGFYHLTSCDYEKTGFENRELDEDRCERLNWIKPVIENYGCSDSCCHRLLTWSESRGRYERTWILFVDERYIVVLDKRKGYYVVVTAYYIDEEHEHEYQRYLAQHLSK